eukprot:2430005-Pyramimonas_sp.AAC.1
MSKSEKDKEGPRGGVLALAVTVNARPPGRPAKPKRRYPVTPHQPNDPPHQRELPRSLVDDQAAEPTPPKAFSTTSHQSMIVDD